ADGRPLHLPQGPRPGQLCIRDSLRGCSDRARGRHREGRSARARRRRPQAVACLEGGSGTQGAAGHTREFSRGGGSRTGRRCAPSRQRFQGRTGEADNRSRARRTDGDGRMSIFKDTAMAVLTKAVQLAPDSWMPGAHPDPLIEHKHGLIGASISRLDGPVKVQGHARFAAEFPIKGMVYSALAYSTIPKGRIASLDTSAAEAAIGVVLVMTHRNAPHLKRTPLHGSAAKAVGGDDLPVMQDDLIHWNGQPIAIVLAETQEQADHATTLIRAIYEKEAATTEFSAAKTAGLKPGNFLGQPLKCEIGDAEAALAAAPHKVDIVYRTPRHSHNAIELHAATVAWEGDELRIHDASQGVAHMAWSLARIFGLDEKKVHVTSPYVGGAFGGKTGVWTHHVLAAAASKLAGRPVRIMLAREGVYRVVGGRTNTEQRVAIGAQADGRFDALIHTGVVAMSAHNNMPKLEVEAEKDPTTGLRFSSRHIVEAYRSGAKRFGWSERNATPGVRREGEWLVGMG